MYTPRILPAGKPAFLLFLILPSLHTSIWGQCIVFQEEKNQPKLLAIIADVLLKQLEGFQWLKVESYR